MLSSSEVFLSTNKTPSQSTEHKNRRRFKSSTLKRLLSYFVILAVRYYFAKFAAGLNLIDLRAGIWIFSFVAGLIPVRAGLSTTEKVPNPMS